MFAGFGYNLANPAFNAGLSCKLVTDKTVVPVLTAMYGYNAVIKLKYAYGGVDAKTYYGPTVGAGCEIFSRDRKQKWLLELLVPFRNKAFRDRYDELEEAGVDFNPDILPVTLTVGYNFSVGRGKN